MEDKAVTAIVCAVYKSNGPQTRIADSSVIRVIYRDRKSEDAAACGMGRPRLIAAALHVRHFYIDAESRLENLEQLIDIPRAGIC